MEKMLLMQVYLLDDRYHGEGDWPPSPARLFQALVAGNAIGARLPDECGDALRWLESLPDPPEIRARHARPGLPYTTFVPNNDLDAKGGDPRQVANIRVGKRIQPRHLDMKEPIIYGWRFTVTDDAVVSAKRVCEMADNLYQLGRGLDMAWARAALLDLDAGEKTVDAVAGEVYRPGTGRCEVELDCPQPGSLASLTARFEANRERFRSVKDGRKVKVYFTNPPKARFRRVGYNPSLQWRLYDLRAERKGSPFRPWPQDRAVALVEQVRDKAAERLARALPDQTEVIDRFLIGRNATDRDKARRVRLLPLPSIGYEKTDRAIRRLLLMAPPDCPLRFDDLEWAVSGLELVEDGAGTILTKSEDVSMLCHYALESGSSFRHWRSVTPVVLPQVAARRRIDPKRTREEAKSGSERVAEEQKAGQAVLQSLRQAGIHAHVDTMRVQREPFATRGERVEAFAKGTRFAKERLWHVELRFAEPMEGPIAIGDGRYLGLGVLAPEPEPVGILAYRIENGLADGASAEQLARALRRAVMARVQRLIGPRASPNPFFTGHNEDGSPLRSGQHRHLAFAADLTARRLLVIAPHILERRQAGKDERRNLEILDLAMHDFDSLKAGSAGRLKLSALFIDPGEDQLFRRSQVWESLTPYRPTRYAKKLSAADALTADVLREVSRRQFPQPRVEVLSVQEGPRGGLEGMIRLEFPTAQTGPVILGRTCHLGGGLFAPGRPRHKAVDGSSE